MRIGLINQLHGRPGGDPPPPSWASLEARARAAEAVGFDSFVYEDALLYRGDETEDGYRDGSDADGCWEAVSISGALAAVTERMEIGPSVFNAPYRSAALLARIADTLDEISGGRFVFGLGAGNTADSDYEAFGFPTDRRYSRFEEAIQIIHGLLKSDAVDFDGVYHSAKRSELVLRGPRSGGPPIMIAAGGPKMMRLTARYADAWNWWSWGQHDSFHALREKVEQFEAACDAEGRDPATIGRTVDVYSFDLTGDSGKDHAMVGTQVEMAEALLGLADLGFDEARVDLYPKTVGAVEAFGPIIDQVHAG
jgi:alkanesulfonate monooxygenase SsuD/methylene tetrahydromethanopterin reductase-like flavin-dependent oxidoreductase (luciferase family)